MDKIADVLAKHTVSGDDSTVNKLLGAAVIVVNKDGILYSGATGRIDFNADAAPFTVDTFGWIASMTKLITTTAAMQMVEKSLITLDKDVRSLVPDLDNLEILRGFDANGAPIVEKNTAPVTLRHLLTHTLGMAYEFPGTPELTRYNEHIGRTDHLGCFTKAGFSPALIFAPGEGWAYGAALDWAGKVIEQVTGQRLDTYLKERVFDPLGMKSTAFFPDVPAAARDHQTILPIRGADGSLLPCPSLRPRAQEFLSGGAGLASTAHDYATFLVALLGGKLVSEETMDEMFRPQLNQAQRERLVEQTNLDRSGFVMGIPEGTPLDHGIGGVINVGDIPGKRKAGSMSWSGATNPRWWIDRQSGVACVMFVNQWPWGDRVVADLFDELEKTVYAAL